MSQLTDAIVTHLGDKIKLLSEEKLHTNTIPEDAHQSTSPNHLPVVFTSNTIFHQNNISENGLKASRFNNIDKNNKNLRLLNETCSSLKRLSVRSISLQSTIEKNCLENKCSDFFNHRSKKTSQMDESHQKMQDMKNLAYLAMQNNKVFVCNGPYTSLHKALRRRGWVEQRFKAMNAFSQESPDSELNEDAIFGENENGGYFEIMSRLVRNAVPSFIWTLKRDDIGFRFLHKDQIINHYTFAWAFTTKSGLCAHLRNLHHFDDLNADSFFPRCYRLCCQHEREEFIDDFRITAAQGLLKIVVAESEKWAQIKNSENVVVENSLPPMLLETAIKACYLYLESKAHLDIEEDYNQHINDDLWNSLLEYYYKVSRNEFYIENGWQYQEECKTLLNKLSCFFPQMKIDGCQNLWILKPGAKSRGRGIEIMNSLDTILKVSSHNVSKKEDRLVIQKYIERPFLVHRTKFDIRQWFLVTDWNPLVLWIYKDSYIRYCGQEFCLDKFDPQVHLSNNSIQKHYKNGKRSKHLPEFNMWFSDEFKTHIIKRGFKTTWDDVIYPGMKTAVIATLQSCQNSLEYRKNSFELYGADFMLDENLNPWLIEINSSPALSPSTPVTEKLCNNVLEDTMKVILDRRENKNCDVGRFDLAYKQQYINVPSYMGCPLSIEGISLSKKKTLDAEKVRSQSDKYISFTLNSYPADTSIISPSKDSSHVSESCKGSNEINFTEQSNLKTYPTKKSQKKRIVLLRN